MGKGGMKSRRSISGMTMTELVVVMAVMSILAAVAMPMYKVSVQRTKEIELKRDLREMRDAIDEYKRYVDEGRISKATDSGYPPDLETLTKPINIANRAPMPITGAKPTTPGGAKPTTGGTLPPSVRFLRKIPIDPMTGDAEWGMRSNQDDPESTVWGGDDVFDVYSLSEDYSLDGETRYNEW